MLFTVILQNFVVLHTRSTMQALYNIDDDDATFSVNFADSNDGTDFIMFDIGAEVTIDERDPASFTVEDVEGNRIEFSAYTPARLPHVIPDDMTIRKATVTFTYMYDTNVNSDAEVAGMSLGEILRECDTGLMLGMTTGSTVEGVPNERTADEERALGCDGTFFADPDELEHARMDAEAAAEGDE